jgi:predicted dehydrogenase
VDEATEDIDAAFIANCNGDGSDHKELAEPFLEKGVPLFVDKPFALELKDAKAIVDLAQKTNTPIMSASILGYIPDLRSIKAGMAEIGNVRFGIIYGPAATQAGFVHTFALAQAVFGTGVEAVDCCGSCFLKYIELHFPDGLEVVILNAPSVDGMSVEIFGDARFPRPRSIRRQGIGDPSFTMGAYTIACLFRDMVRMRKPPIDYASMVEIIAMGEAARLAQREKRRVALAELDA